MRKLPAVAGRDLVAYFHTPAGLAVAALFLTLQGVVLWMFVQFLGRPDAPPGAVMEFFFGGTILYWIAMALLATVLPMRLLAEEFRSGTIETLLTAPVTMSEVVVGKWLAAVAYFLALWTPTLLYLVYLRAVGAAMDPGPLIAGYLGTILVGGAALALGLLASSLTRNQLVAATLSFVAFFLVLLLGVLEMQVAAPGAVQLLRRLSLFRMMEDFGHGIVDSRHVILLCTAMVLGLLGALRVLAIRTGRSVGGRTKRGLAPALLAPALVLLIAGMVNYLAGRHYVRGDWTRTGVYALSEKTVNVLRGLQRPVSVTVFLYPRRGGEEARALGGLVRELCDRFARHAPGLFQVELVDPDRNPERAEALQKKNGIAAHEMNEGVVIFTSGGRSKYLGRDDLVDYDLESGDGAGGHIRAWKGEPAFVGALLTVTDDHPPVVCFAGGHGEPDSESVDDGGYATFADDVRRDGNQTRNVARLTSDGVPAACTVLVIAEPQQAYAEGDLAAVETYLDRGGRLLLMMGPVFNRNATGFAHVGLEALAARWGIRLGDNLVVDPEHASEVEGPSVWAAGADNYASHALTARLGGRPTYWPRTREVTRMSPGTPAAPSNVRALEVRPFVHTSDKGWGEVDLTTIRGEGDLVFDKGKDQPGPIDVAVAVDATPSSAPAPAPTAAPTPNKPPRARLVVFGTGRLVMNYRLSGMLLRDYNRDLVLSAVAWLADREVRVGIGPKIPEQIKLTLQQETVAWAFRLFVVGLPLLCLMGAVVVWMKRRV
ncbi:MAG TPA: Gldg family protein [Polyangia bacterium]|jgi:ABC-2 type transport system permease protein|nr:Gldg family protein [Polyangia bacterium]